MKVYYCLWSRIAHISFSALLIQKFLFCFLKKVLKIFFSAWNLSANTLRRLRCQRIALTETFLSLCASKKIKTPALHTRNICQKLTIILLISTGCNHSNFRFLHICDCNKCMYLENRLLKNQLPGYLRSWGWHFLNIGVKTMMHTEN